MRGNHPAGSGSHWPSRSLLGRLGPGTRTALLSQCRPVTFADGEHLLNQGDLDRHAIVLFEGTVRIHVIDAGGFDGLLAVRQRGDMIGELAALSGEPRTASVVAVDEVQAGSIAGPALADFLAGHPDATRQLIRVLGERLDWANRRRIDFAARPAQSKIAHVLADLAATAEAQDGVLHVHLSQQDLASIVGIALGTAEGALRALAAQGLVERGYREVLVLDLDRLADVAQLRPHNPHI